MEKLNTRCERGLQGSAVFTRPIMRISGIFSGVYLICLTVMVGCSPGMFFGGGKDERVLKTPNYRKINTACAGMKLESSTIDNKTFRSMVKCFNSNKALEPVEALVQGMTDTELAPLVKATNEYILNDKETLYKLEKTYYSLQNRDLVQPAFTHFGKLLRRDLVSSSIALFKDGYLSDSGSSGPDSDFLVALELLGTKLKPDNVADSLNLGLNTFGSNAFKDLHSLVVRGSGKGGIRATYDLARAADGVQRYLSDSHKYSCGGQSGTMDIRRELLDGILSGDWFSILDEVVGTDAATVGTKASRLNFLFKATLTPPSSGSTLFENLTLAMQEFHRPIQCMKGAQVVPDGARHLVSRMLSLPRSEDAAKYILHEGLLEHAALRPVCDLPPSVDAHYQSMIKLAKTGALTPLVDVFRALDRPVRPWIDCSTGQATSETYHPMTSFLVNFMGDRGSGQSGGALALIPFLVGVTEFDAWPELLLLSSLHDAHDRQLIQDSLQFLVQPQPRLNGKSIFDVLNKVVSRASYRHILDFFKAADRFVNDRDFREEPAFLETSLTHVRNAFHINDAHPLIDVGASILLHAGENRQLIQTLFEISDRDEFLQSVELFSTMAKDGRLQELVKAVITIFHRFAEQAKDTVVVEEKNIPAFESSRRHDLTRRDLTDHQLGPVDPQDLSISPACGDLKLDFSLDDPSSAAFGTQVQYLLRCLDKQDIQFVVQFLLDKKTPASNGSLSYYELLMRWMKRVASGSANPTADSSISSPAVNPLGLPGLTTEELSFLMDRWLASLQDKSLFRALDGLSIWIGPRTPDVESSPSVLNPLFKLVRHLMDHVPGDLHNVEVYLARVIQDSELPKLLADLEALAKKQSPPVVAPVDHAVYHEASPAELARWVEVKECSDLPNNPRAKREYIARRVSEIYDDARNAVTGFELVPGPSGKKISRKEWQLADLKKIVDPLLKKTADPSQSIAERTFLQAQLNFLGGYNGRYGRPVDLLNWLYARSIDYKPITYYYPGEDKPRVRLVNSLDRLDETLWNTDMIGPLPPYKNMGLDFLEELAEAWGDVPRSQWPEPIRRKYPDPRKPPRTLLEAVRDITNREAEFENLNKLSFTWVGLPPMPSCNPNTFKPDPVSGWFVPGGWIPASMVKDFQRRLFNLHQVNSVLFENAPGSHMGFNGGLEVLRNLFFEVFYSSPEGYRNPTAGDKNNLSGILWTVRSGGFRQIGRHLQNFAPDDPELIDLFSTVVRSADSPHMAPLMQRLLSIGENRDLIWKLITEIFGVIDEGGETLVHLKKAGFYGLAEFNRLQAQGGDLVPLLIERVAEVLDLEGQFLLDHPDLVRDFIREGKAGPFLEAAYSDLDADGRVRFEKLLLTLLSKSADREPFPVSAIRVARAAWDAKASFNGLGNALGSGGGIEQASPTQILKELKTRIDAVLQDPRYQSLRMGEFKDSALKFFKHRDTTPGSDAPASTVAAAASDKLRIQLAHLLESGELDQVLILMKDSPDELYRIFHALSRTIGSGNEGELKDFLEMLRRSLSEPLH